MAIFCYCLLLRKNILSAIKYNKYSVRIYPNYAKKAVFESGDN